MKRLIHSLILVFLLVACCFGWANYIGLRVRVSLAEEQTRYFEEAVLEAAKKPTPDPPAGYIEAIQNYYPSGTKQLPGSHLDLMVERSRAGAIKMIEKQHLIMLQGGEPKPVSPVP